MSSPSVMTELSASRVLPPRHINNVLWVVFFFVFLFFWRQHSFFSIMRSFKVLQYITLFFCYFLNITWRKIWRILLNWYQFILRWTLGRYRVFHMQDLKLTHVSLCTKYSMLVYVCEREFVCVHSPNCEAFILDSKCHYRPFLSCQWPAFCYVIIMWFTCIFSLIQLPWMAIMQFGHCLLFN